MNRIKKTLLDSGVITSIFLLVFIIFFAGYKLGTEKNRKIVHVDFTEHEYNQEIEHCKYQFMSADLSIYIENLSKELDIDSDLVVAILLVENPCFNPDAEHRNENGTNDLGLFQLNDRYIYSNFVPNYWDMDIEFNPFNIKHNTFLALHHIRYLSERLKIQDDIIAAYNAGIGAVMNQTIPSSTINYVKAVKTNYKLLQGNK